jgi:hypothetical protein
VGAWIPLSQERRNGPQLPEKRFVNE